MMDSKTAEEAKAFASAMIGKKVAVTVAQGSVEGRTTTQITLSQGSRTFDMYAEANPDCYSDLSKVMPMSKDGLVLTSAAVSDHGVHFNFEDSKTGVAVPAIRVLLSKRVDCTRILSYQCSHQKAHLQAVA